MLDSIALLIALLHIYIFAMESLLWTHPRTIKAFRMNAADAHTTRVFAFNQGFYNLFLSMELLAGLYLVRIQSIPNGRILIDFAALSVFGAGLVLFFSERKLRAPAMAQAVPAMAYLLIRFFV